jgi:hypothetical protein
MSRANAGGVGPGKSPRITRLVKRRASANPSLSCKAGERARALGLLAPSTFRVGGCSRWIPAEPGDLQRTIYLVPTFGCNRHFTSLTQDRTRSLNSVWVLSS